MGYTVRAVSDLAGISIRALHHYDEIGLLKPAQKTASGYRLYTEGDLELLQQVLFFRELGFSLREIKEIINSPGFDRRQALLDHKQLLLEWKERLRRLWAIYMCRTSGSPRITRRSSRAWPSSCMRL